MYIEGSSTKQAYSVLIAVVLVFAAGILVGRLISNSDSSRELSLIPKTDDPKRTLEHLQDPEIH
jgi:hypothetical protein